MKARVIRTKFGNIAGKTHTSFRNMEKFWNEYGKSPHTTRRHLTALFSQCRSSRPCSGKV